jgi:hypothetical protein
LRIGWVLVFLFLLRVGATGVVLAASSASDAVADDASGSENTATRDFVYDPWQGIERDGRIPAAEFPEDLANPGRWRYIPEAHIKPGNIFDRFLVTSFMAPYAFHDSDVGTGAGLALADNDFRLQRRREFIGAFASYTTEGQQGFGMIWDRWMHQRDLPAGGVLIEDRSFWHGRVSYSKTLTRRFFGLGSNTKQASETSYTDEVVRLEFGFERAVPEPASSLVVGLGLGAELHELSPGRVKRGSGRPQVSDLSLEDAALYRRADNRDLGRLQASLRWDTRDSTINPYSGWAVGADVDAAVLQKGGKEGALYRLFGNWVRRVPGLFHSGGSAGEENPPTDTFALGFRSELTSGDLPFFALPTLGGGHDMRGFIEGRFRGGASWIGSAEYRFWFIPRGFPIPFTKTIRIERMGAALFYDAGAVAEDGDDLFSVKVRHSFGLGLRFTLERTAPFRFDLGFSEDGYEVSAGFGFTF